MGKRWVDRVENRNETPPVETLAKHSPLLARCFPPAAIPLDTLGHLERSKIRESTENVIAVPSTMPRSVITKRANVSGRRLCAVAALMSRPMKPYRSIINHTPRPVANQPAGKVGGQGLLAAQVQSGFAKMLD